MSKRKDRITRAWSRRVRAAVRERRYAGFRPQPGRMLDVELVGWSEVVRSKRRETGRRIMSFRLAFRGEPPIPREAHRPPTGVHLARAYAYRFFRESGEPDGEARRLAACFELDGWKLGGSFAKRYRDIRRRRQRSGVRWFASVLKAVARLGGKRSAADEDDREDYLGGDVVDNRSREIRFSFMEDVRPSRDVRTLREDGPAFQPWTDFGKDLPDDPDKVAANAEFVKLVDRVAKKVNESVKEVGRGVPTPPVKFDGTRRLVLGDGALVAEEIPLRGSEDECKTEAELHRFHRTLPAPVPCQQTCAGGRALPGEHGHCASCGVPVAALAFTIVGPDRARRFFCSERCWNAIRDAARREEAPTDK